MLGLGSIATAGVERSRQQRVVQATSAIVACPGRWPELRELALGYMAQGSLDAFYTTFEPGGDRLSRMLCALPGRTGGVTRGIAGRRASSIEPVEAVAPVLDLVHAAVYRLTGKSAANRFALAARDQWFDRRVSRRLHPADVLVTQAGAAERSLRAASRHGVQRTVVNWNIQYLPFARKQVELERELNPEWMPTFSHSRFPRSVVARWERELDQADRVLVPSTSVKQSLVAAGVRLETIIQVPYGVDAEKFVPSPRSDRERLRVICVGEIGQRKGTSYFFEAARRLPHMDFVLVGWHVARLPEECPHNVVIHNNVPDVAPYLRESNVFLFPSLLDGFGLVVLQALASGLPVLCSSLAGACDVVTDGSNGWVIDPRNVSSYIALLERIDSDRAQLDKMSEAARATALEYSWDRFRAGVIEGIAEAEA